ncbi:hypothetical protein HNP46_000330 [Pseudomonas nitritireducens]|uniref:Uncharacterized protein n=1 Tax=Pseudomonas nitroreducens TaxID=46680 RepID=A0A7W7KFT3_PSENT|nr:hypothetical protein [Pseudomonas nitritireducens]MBB4861519.1 hypothetical protein [Pseudomonas nitritireducens]
MSELKSYAEQIAALDDLSIVGHLLNIARGMREGQRKDEFLALARVKLPGLSEERLQQCVRQLGNHLAASDAYQDDLVDFKAGRDWRLVSNKR